MNRSRKVKKSASLSLPTGHHLGKWSRRARSGEKRRPRSASGHGVRGVPVARTDSGKRIGTAFQLRARNAHRHAAQTQKRSRTHRAAGGPRGARHTHRAQRPSAAVTPLRRLDSRARRAATINAAQNCSEHRCRAPLPASSASPRMARRLVELRAPTRRLLCGAPVVLSAPPLASAGKEQLAVEITCRSTAGAPTTSAGRRPPPHRPRSRARVGTPRSHTVSPARGCASRARSCLARRRTRRRTDKRGAHADNALWRRVLGCCK